MGIIQSSPHDQHQDLTNDELPISITRAEDSLSSDVIACIASYLRTDESVLNLSFCCKNFYSAIHYSEYMNDYWTRRLTKYFSFHRWNRSLLLTAHCDKRLNDMLKEYVTEYSRIRYMKKKKQRHMPPISYFLQTQIESLRTYITCQNKVIIVTGSSVNAATDAIDGIKRMAITTNYVDVYDGCDTWHQQANELARYLKRVVVVSLNGQSVTLIRLERWSCGEWRRFRTHEPVAALFCYDTKEERNAEMFAKFCQEQTYLCYPVLVLSENDNLPVVRNNNNLTRVTNGNMSGVNKWLTEILKLETL